MLYVSEDGTNWGTASDKKENQTEGSEIELTASGLSEYTEYYWKIDVSDNKLLDSTDKQEALRTKCSGKGLKCSDAERIKCEICDGVGQLTHSTKVKYVSVGSQWYRGPCMICGDDYYVLIYTYTCPSTPEWASPQVVEIYAEEYCMEDKLKSFVYEHSHECSNGPDGITIQPCKHRFRR